MKILQSFGFGFGFGLPDASIAKQCLLLVNQLAKTGKLSFMFSLNEKVYNIRVHVEPTLQQLPITRPLEGFQSMVSWYLHFLLS